MANPENKQIPYESTQKDIRDAIESVATAIGGITHPDAEDIVYDNSVSGLSATDVQNAIDELSSEKADSSSLATVATSGDYDDLINKPTIPTVNDATLTIQKNGSDVATFTANASSNVTANITVPTTTSELTNNSNFVSDASYVHTDNNFTNAEKTKLSSIESGAEVNVQSDWNQSDNTADDYIKNKPNIEELTADTIADLKTPKNATITDGVAEFDCLEDNYVKSLTADIEPVQDLHGYDHPWVGGAGKNKLPLVLADIKSANTSGTWSGNTYSSNGVAFELLTDSDNNIIGIKVNGTATANVFFSLITTYVFPANTYIVSGGVSSNAKVIVRRGNTAGSDISSAPPNQQFTVDGEESVGILIRVASGEALTNAIFEPMIRLSTESDDTFKPYTNICSITGHTEVDLYNVGKNLYDISKINMKSYRGVTIERVKDKLHVYGTATESIGFAFGDFHLMTGSYVYSSTTENLPMVLLRGYTQISNNIPTAFTVTSASDTYRFRFQLVNGTTYDFYVSDVQIEKGSTATSYEPYNGYNDTISLGQTVYGGTFKAVEGEMIEVTINYASTDLGDRTWQKSSSGDNNFYSNVAGNIVYKMKKDVPMYCDRYKYFGTKSSAPFYPSSNGFCAYYASPTGSVRELYFHDIRYNDVSSFQSAMSGVQLVYELATPIVLTLPKQLFKAFLGENNVSVSTGDITELKFTELFTSLDYDTTRAYKVDISALGTDESGRTTASRAYTTGEFFYMDGKMYKVLTSIASGATFTVGTNISETTLFAELTALA